MKPPELNGTAQAPPDASCLESELPVASGMSDRSALTSWKRGHHVFFLFTQALILCIYRINVALEKKDYLTAKTHLDYGAILLNGSAIAMEMAGDCRTEEYNQEIRPTMPEGFSGLDSPDHDFLIKEYAKLKKLCNSVPPSLMFTYRRFEQAAAGALAAHLGVCERFGGKDTGSLKSESKTTKSAYEVLQSLGRSRLPTASACPYIKKI